MCPVPAADISDSIGDQHYRRGHSAATGATLSPLLTISLSLEEWSYRVLGDTGACVVSTVCEIRDPGVAVVFNRFVDLHVKIDTW